MWPALPLQRHYCRIRMVVNIILKWWRCSLRKTTRRRSDVQYARCRRLETQAGLQVAAAVAQSNRVGEILGDNAADTNHTDSVFTGAKIRLISSPRACSTDTSFSPWCLRRYFILCSCDHCPYIQLFRHPRPLLHRCCNTLSSRFFSSVMDYNVPNRASPCRWHCCGRHCSHNPY